MKKSVSLVTGALVCLILVLSFALSAAAADDQAKLNVNTATVEQLAKVPGLNETLAKEIVQYREEMGDIKSMDELLEIKGFDKALLEKIQESIMIEGVSGSDCTC